MDKTIRVWLRENNYEDIADMIDGLLDEWNSQGKKTRRNWWEVLAGGKDGRPRTICGRVFPVLKAARQRQGLPDVINSICRNNNELIPGTRNTNRWPHV